MPWEKIQHDSFKELAAALTGGEAFLPAQQLQEKHEVGLGIDGKGGLIGCVFCFSWDGDAVFFCRGQTQNRDKISRL